MEICKELIVVAYIQLARSPLILLMHRKSKVKQHYHKETKNKVVHDAKHVLLTI